MKKNDALKAVEDFYKTQNNSCRTAYVALILEVENSVALKLLKTLESEGKIVREVYGSYNSGRSKWMPSKTKGSDPDN